MASFDLGGLAIVLKTLNEVRGPFDSMQLSEVTVERVSGIQVCLSGLKSKILNEIQLLCLVAVCSNIQDISQNAK